MNADQSTLKTSCDPETACLDIVKQTGHATYGWDLGSDKIAWSENFRSLVGFREDADPSTGRAYERLLNADNPTTRFGTVTSSQARNPGSDGVAYQCVYSVNNAHTHGEEAVWIEDTGRWFPGADGKAAYAQGIVRVVSDRRKREEVLRRKSDYDDLTKLPNRRFLQEKIEEFATSAFEESTSAAFLILSVNRMELINDTYGFTVGDEVLCHIGSILGTKLREHDIISRFSGAKFGVLLKNCSSSEVFIAAKRFLSALSKDVFQSSAGPIALSGSIGGCLLPRHAKTAGNAVSHAMHALREGRHDRTLKIGIYSPNPHLIEQRQKDAAMVSDIIDAVQESRVRLAYQPVVDASTHRIAFHEALLRMEDRSGKISEAAGFVSVAERLGMVRYVDHSAMDLAIQTLFDFPQARLSLNVSVETAEDPEWLSRLAQRLSGNRSVAERLIIEITESQVVTDLEEAVRFVELVRGLGCSVAIDDFGSGFTSFASLGKLRVNWVKVDGSFTANLAENVQNQVFIKALISIAKVHDIKTVVEYVDDPETAAMLADWGVDCLQGYAFGVPLIARPWEKSDDKGVVAMDENPTCDQVSTA